MVKTLSIDNETHELTGDNYYSGEFKKTQIVLGHSHSSDLNHLVSWKTRMNGKYKKTAPFSIDVNGKIHQHFNPKYWSNFIGVDNIDKHIIPIVIENEGWLIKNKSNNDYIDWIGNIYNRRDEVVNKRWRTFSNWAPYTSEQMDSVVNLIKHVCVEFSIPQQTVGHNTENILINSYKGVGFRSNYNKKFTDLSPAWNFEEFKDRLVKK
jgi:N-acetyl-anhydromuramyl-L-alanine amidase AmpD